ncbi:hypothetical protein WJX72_006008 [[Myrmecia] bisecta]|uniref:Prefoldin subunit 4 n=1 Tax=[Myrmecia] bisecta TaxID=41462 RepID=A0AAW1QFA1_9CHLO
MSKAKDVEVTFEDQQRINTFGKLNLRFHELEAEMRHKKTLLDDLEDASNELMLTDEEQVRYVVGECFYYANAEEATERIEAATAEAQTEMDRLKQELQQTTGKMAELKQVLYGKFGDSINLEED